MILTALRHAAQSVWRDRSFALLCTLTLSLGTGTVVSAITIANRVLQPDVPGVRDASDVRVVWSGIRKGPTSITISRVSYPNYLDVSRVLRTVRLAGYSANTTLLRAAGISERPVRTAFVTPAFFEILGVTQRLGRSLVASDDVPGAATPLAVISDALWTSMFARDPNILGRQVAINGWSFVVVGVTDVFRGIDSGSITGSGRKSTADSCDHVTTIGVSVS